MFWHCQFKDLDESFQNPYSDLKKVQSASSYGHFIARKEFWPQCKVLCFGVLFCSVFLVELIPIHELCPCASPFSFLLIFSYNSITLQRQEGRGHNSWIGPSGQDKRSQGLKGNRHIQIAGQYDDNNRDKKLLVKTFPRALAGISARLCPKR